MRTTILLFVFFLLVFVLTSKVGYADGCAYVFKVSNNATGTIDLSKIDNLHPADFSGGIVEIEVASATIKLPAGNPKDIKQEDKKKETKESNSTATEKSVEKRQENEDSDLIVRLSKDCDVIIKLK